MQKAFLKCIPIFRSNKALSMWRLFLPTRRCVCFCLHSSDNLCRQTLTRTLTRGSFKRNARANVVLIGYKCPPPFLSDSCLIIKLSIFVACFFEWNYLDHFVQLLMETELFLFKDVQPFMHFRIEVVMIE